MLRDSESSYLNSTGKCIQSSYVATYLGIPLKLAYKDPQLYSESYLIMIMIKKCNPKADKHWWLVFSFFEGRHKVKNKQIKRSRAFCKACDRVWAREKRQSRAYKMHHWAACLPDTWLFLFSLTYFKFYPFASPPHFSLHIPSFSPSSVFYLRSPDCALTLQSFAPLINSLSWACRWQ